MIRNVYKLGLGLFVSLGVAQAACDTATAFMPDGTRTYQMTSAQGSSTMTTKTKTQGNNIVVETSVGGRTTTTTWTCTSKGLSTTMNGKISMDMGFLPSLKLWKPGYTWTSEGNMTGAMNMHFTSRNTVVKQERISTPAGSFDTYRIDGVTTTKLNLPPGTKLPAGMAALNGQQTKTTSWYARGVGAVKTSGPNYSMTLIKYAR